MSEKNSGNNEEIAKKNPPINGDDLLQSRRVPTTIKEDVKTRVNFFIFYSTERLN